MNAIKIEFDNTKFVIKEITTENGDIYQLSGSCNRCGKCCMYSGYTIFNKVEGQCEKLVYETLDGKPCYRCSVYENRPVGCVLWPRTTEDLNDIPECTYKMIKIN